MGMRVFGQRTRFRQVPVTSGKATRENEAVHPGEDTGQGAKSLGLRPSFVACWFSDRELAIPGAPRMHCCWSLCASFPCQDSQEIEPKGSLRPFLSLTVYDSEICSTFKYFLI